jgi:hypothetical protein
MLETRFPILAGLIFSPRQEPHRTKAIRRTIVAVHHGFGVAVGVGDRNLKSRIFTPEESISRQDTEVGKGWQPAWGLRPRMSPIDSSLWLE